MYLITGASGNTGKRIALNLLRANQQVIAVSRNAEHIQELIQHGAIPAIGDLRDSEFMTNQLKKAKAAYLLIPPNFQVDDFRAYQFETADSLSKAVKESGIKHVVMLSSVGAHLNADSGVILGLHYFEQQLKSIEGLNTIALRAGFFMQNFLNNIGLIKNMNIHGGFPIEGQIRFGMIHVNDIADAATSHLLALNFSGFSFQNLTGERELSLAEATAVLGKAIGKPELPWVTFSYEDAKNGMVGAGIPENLANLYVDFSKAINDGRLLTDFQSDLNSKTPTSIEAFAAEFAAAYNN